MLILPLRSPRLILRDFIAEDLEPYGRLRSGLAFGRHYPAAETAPAFSSRLLDRFISQQQSPRRAWQLAVIRRDDGKLVGSVGLRLTVSPGVASFGAELAEAAWGQGYVEEAARLLLDAGFNHLGVNRVEADTAEGNAAALRLAGRLGFVAAPTRDGRVSLALSLGMLGAQSEWRLLGASSSLRRIDGGWRLLTEDQPGFYFGNALWLDHGPEPGSRREWERRFAAAFADYPAIRHRVLQWPRGAPASAEAHRDWLDAGYRYEETIVLLMTGETLRPVPLSPSLTIRPLTSDEDWAQWRRLLLDARDAEHLEEDYLSFLAGHERRYRQLEAEGCGHTWGVFDGWALLSCAGLFLQPGLGCVQQVATAEHVRRLGLASQLLSHIAQWGLQRAPRILVAADAHYHALQLYRQLGFVDAGREASLCWWPGRA